MKIIPENQLRAEEVHRMLLETLETHLSLKTEGYRCTTEQVLNVLVKAAAEGSSLEAVCSDQPSGLDGNTLREQLNAALDVTHLRQQEAEMNQALASAIPVAMPRGGLEVAIDTHDEPFYGKTPEMLTYTRKAQAKDGTSRFFRLASAYVIWHEVRLTLALTYVLPEDDLPGVVRRLLHRLAHLGFHATVLYLDKGFCSGEVIRHLQQVGQATVLACPDPGKRGHSRVCRGRGSRITDYSFRDGTQCVWHC
jgi:putative transposase